MSNLIWFPCSWRSFIVSNSDATSIFCGDEEEDGEGDKSSMVDLSETVKALSTNFVRGPFGKNVHYQLNTQGENMAEILNLLPNLANPSWVDAALYIISESPRGCPS